MYDDDDNKNKITEAVSSFALITGASKGLGKAFAIELAKKKINLLLVALPDDGLPGLCENLKESYKIKCHYFETDLTGKNSIEELCNWATGNFGINILINNAGMGGSMEFELAEAKYLDNIISLNIRALTLLTHRLLPELKSHKQSYILNVSSMASFSPMAYKTIYSASKVYIQYFTRGLFEELKGTGVFVSVVHPGPMKTNIHVRERISKQGMFCKFGLLTPEYVAEKSLEKLFRYNSLIILGWFNHLCWLAMKTVPLWISLPVITKIFKKELAATGTSKDCREVV